MRMEQQVNRRRWERYPFDASVRVVVDHGSVEHSSVDHSAANHSSANHSSGNHSPKTTVVDARGVQFSEGGICLFAAANLPVGSHIKVEFKNPHTNEPVRVRGKVRNRSVYLYGVEFLANEFEDARRLARLGADIRNPRIVHPLPHLSQE
jgi:hypothetical protein